MKKHATLLALFLPTILLAQTPLTLKSAVDSALQNNFDIQIAKNNQAIGRTNNSFGMAGGLPTVSLNAADNASNYNLHQELSSGANLDEPSVTSNTISANATASMVLFNGFKVLATKNKLTQLQKQSEIQLNQQIQNTMASVMGSYYSVLKSQSYLAIDQSLLDVSTQKLDIINARYSVGMANQADILQAQMDQSNAQQVLYNQQLIVDAEKTNLQQLMGQRQFYSIAIHDTILIDKTLQKDSILNYLQSNTQYQVAEQQVKINQQVVKELGAQRLPTLRAIGGYNFASNDVSVGNTLLTQTYGPTVGATLQIPIFNGTIYSRQQKVARFNVQNSELQKESLLASLNAGATRTYQSYQNAITQLETQQITYENAQKLVALVVQRFQLNQATILDVKAAQNSLEQAGYMLVNLQYTAKVSEIELKRLVYKLTY